jgi:methionyl-tRNA formyltransferase
MAALRVAILHSDDHHHRYLESLLRSRFEVAAVMVEPSQAKIRRLMRRGRYRDVVYQRYHELRRRVTGKDRYRRAYFQHAPELWRDPGTHRVLVDSINSDEVVQRLSESQPDVTVAIGCSILKKPVLEAAGGRLLNVHGGYLPYYRGNHCVFFALYDGRLDRVGVSLHYIDAGVDTGGLVEVLTPPTDGTETAEKLYCRSEKLAINRLADLLGGLEAGDTLPAHPQLPVGRTYRTRDRGPTHDLREWERRTRRAIRSWIRQGS